jgi:glycolate oxidase
MPQNDHDQLRTGLQEIVGSEWVSDDQAILESYGKDPGFNTVLRKHGKDPNMLPEFVVLPASAQEIQRLVVLARDHGRCVIPMGTGNNQTGLCVPTRPMTITVDTKRMNKILEIDEVNMTATVEPGVSYARLQQETMKRGLWNGGTPLAPSNHHLISQYHAFYGLWQSALKYSMGIRSIVTMKGVTSRGDFLETGSASVPKAGKFWWYGPGPDLKGLLESTTTGSIWFITEATLKLHPWAGGNWEPEEVIDRPPLPRNHRIYFVEFKEWEDMYNCMYQISHCGIGSHLNLANDTFNSCYTQPTKEMTEKVFQDGYFPKLFIYVVLAGISSERQLDYEERVLMDIIKDTRGILRKDEIADVLSTWHGDAFRSATSMRMGRKGSYHLVKMSELPIDCIERIYRDHMSLVEGTEHYMIDEEMPWVYVHDRGYWALHETDSYFDQSDPAEAERSMKRVTTGLFRMVGEEGNETGWYVCGLEPFTTLYGPKIGPDFHLVLQKVKRAFDPTDTMNPGKLVSMEPPPDQQAASS